MAFLLYSLLFSITSDHPEPPFYLCDAPNLAENSSYRSSLDNLLSSMSSDLSPDSKFFQTSNGSGSNKVYGLFLCYDYATQLDCRQCVEESSLPQDVNKHCPYKYEATVWVDYCLFRYSKRNFSGELNVTGNLPLDNAKNVTDPQRFRSIVNRTLHDLVVVAAFDPSSGMHANGSEFFTEGYNLYAFVQCSKDLSPVTCNACLTAAVDDILVDRFYYTRGARVLSRSCFLRYELYNFVEGETEENLNLAPSKLTISLSLWSISISTLSNICKILINFRFWQKESEMDYWCSCFRSRSPGAVGSRLLRLSSS